MKPTIITRTQQQQQIQARQFTLLAALPWQHRSGQGVEGLQLLEVACECVRGLWAVLSDGDEGAELEGFARKEQGGFCGLGGWY